MGLSNIVMKLKLIKWKKRGLKIGKNVNIEAGCSIDPSFPWLVSIGDNVTIAPNVCILAHDASMKYSNGKTKLGVVEIGNNVFIGTKSTVFPGVTIGDNVIIGAGSVVTKSIPSGSVACGMPAKIINTYEQYGQKMSELISVGLNYDRSEVLNDKSIERERMKEEIKEEGSAFINYK